MLHNIHSRTNNHAPRTHVLSCRTSTIKFCEWSRIHTKKKYGFKTSNESNPQTREWELARKIRSPPLAFSHFSHSRGGIFQLKAAAGAGSSCSEGSFSRPNESFHQKHMTCSRLLGLFVCLHLLLFFFGWDLDAAAAAAAGRKETGQWVSRVGLGGIFPLFRVLRGVKRDNTSWRCLFEVVFIAFFSSLLSVVLLCLSWSF